MHRVAVVLLVFACACGTYSMVRPARTLAPGTVEIAAGIAVSELEANPVGHVAVGVGDRVEVLAQNEIWNTFAELRYQVLRDGPVDLAVGAGGGYAVTLVSALTSSGDHDTLTGAAGTVSISAGHSWGRVSLTLGNRSFFLTSGYVATSTRLGLRVRAVGRLGFLVEGGATVHAPLDALSLAFVVGEGTGGLFVEF